MLTFLAYTFTGLFTGAAYAIAASGLVLTYTTTRVFNLGHGAISMVCAFLYWQLTVQEHMNGFLALMLILLVIAPAIGFVIERVLARNLGDAPVSVSLVVTVGLFVGLVGIAQQVWPATESRSINQWFPGDGITIGSYQLSYHQLITILISIAVAAGLYVLLNRTRTGTAMRAAVDNRDLLALFGGSPRRVSTFSWMLGSSLAALAGILLVSTVGLDYYELTFLVINAFAAAMFGRLQSLPLTFVGAMALGLAQGYVFYLPSWSTLDGIRQTLPTIFLFIVLIFVPQVRLRVGQIKGILAAPVPTARRSLQYGGGLVVLVLLAVQVLSDTNQLRLGSALTYAIVMLSLVLLTGYGGYVSMAQLTFMGIGAAVVAKLNTTSPMALVAAVLIAAAVGALIALPVLRLTGLYLALATFAFAQLMDKLVFQTNFMFGFNGNLNAKPMTLFGYSFSSTASYNVLCAVAFVLVGALVLAVRRGPIGRVLIAMRDSQAACGTLGLNQRWFRVGLFGASAGIAGLAGALLAGVRGTVDAASFQAFNGLLLLLLAVVSGVTSVTGAFVGGMLLMLLPVLQSQFPTLGGLEFLIIAVGAVTLGRNPNGLANLGFTAGRWVGEKWPAHWRIQRRRPIGDDRGATTGYATGYAADYSDFTEPEQVARHGVA